MIRYSVRLPRYLVKRQRLYPLLEQTGLVLLQAGPGAGKSTLVAGWGADNPAMDGVWIGLSGAETREELRREIARAFDGGRAATIGFDGGIDRERFTRWLSTLGEQVIVIRDAHLLTETAHIEDLLHIVRICANIRIILLGSILEHVSERAHTENVDTTLITAEDLAFTPEETIEYFRLRNVPDPEGLEKRLRAPLAGHPAATGLAARDSKDPDAWTDPVDGAQRLLDYYLSRLRGELPRADTYARFLALAIPERLPLALVDVITEGDPASARSLCALVGSEGLGQTWDHPRDLILNTLVRQRMLAELYRDHRVIADQTSRRIIRWKMINGYPAEAVGRALKLGDLDLVSEAVWRNFNELTSQHGDFLWATLRKIPLLKIRRHPVLSMTVALLFNASDFTRLRAAEYFTLAISGVRGRLATAVPAERVILLCLQAIAFRVLGRFAQARAGAERTDEQLAQLPDLVQESLGSILPLLHNQLAVIYFYTGDPGRALESLSAAIGSAQPQNHEDPIQALALSAGIHAFAGDIELAASALKRIEGLPPLESISEVFLTTHAALARAIIALESYDVVAARKFLEPYLSELDTSEHWGAILEVLTLCDVLSGERLAAITRLEGRLGSRRQPPLSDPVKTRLTLLRADLQLMGGNVARADRIARQFDVDQPSIILFQARRDIVAGEFERAAVTLARCEPARLGPRHRALLHLLLAVATARIGDGEYALSEAESGLAVLDAQQLGIPLLYVPSSGLELVLAEARVRGREDLVERLDSALRSLSVTWIDAENGERLTARESLVLQQVARGRSTPEIAEELSVSTNTVKSQLRAVYRKLGVNSRQEAVLHAIRNGLLHSDDALDSLPDLEDSPGGG